MPYIYLIRHGKPQFPDNIPLCIGSKTDLPIGEEGKAQAAVWQGCFSQCNTIYHSSLLRAKMTAEQFADGRTLRELDGVQEMDAGEWEAKPFTYLKEHYPEVYDARGRDWSMDLPGGESLNKCGERALTALEKVITHRKQQPDITVVTHDGVIRAILFKLLKLDPTKDTMPIQPYGSVTALEYKNGEFYVLTAGHMPDEYPTMEEIKSLWLKWDTPHRVIDHCKLTAEYCKNVGKEINEKQKEQININRIYASALLHDVARNFKFHAEKGGEILKGAGYTVMAQSVAIHHNLIDVKDDTVTEDELLYWVDKRLQGTEIVSLEERFKKAKAKCNGYEAVKRMEQRFESARKIEAKIIQILGEDPMGR